MPSYTSNDDGTVTDNNTGLIWAQTTDINRDGKITVDDKVTYDEGIAYASSLTLGGHSDWRVPTIKELYSLMLFDGEDPSGINGAGTYSIMPFIDHSVFGFESGDMEAGERLIDSQYLSTTKYVSTTMNGDETIFGVNFIDGRIKGYGATSPRGGEKTFYLLTVRGNTDYGINDLVDNGDKTVTDKATGLTWQQGDSLQGMDWFSAIQYCENLELAGQGDWRMPNIKELHSIVDYSRSPDTTKSAAIDPVFEASTIINEGQKVDYPNYWSSTTHANLMNTNNAAYIAFGRSLGYINGEWIDVHGAGAQRSDPKQYNGVDYPEGHGPQGDAIRYETTFVV
ncbi:internal repeat sequences detected [Vibrio maritimus]|uniref:Internal repeat sequences detected n=1 Tax=Vibrio maritimus TaxID=990268 RepID=A0A090TA66_9VIBR|nr:internal repeat sequences detected [Vibrio maritimus]